MESFNSLQSPLDDEFLHEVTVRLAAIDGGFPRRGTVTNVTLIITETCVFDADEERTPLHLTTGVYTGKIGVAVPKYYFYNYGKDCINHTQKIYI